MPFTIPETLPSHQLPLLTETPATPLLVEDRRALQTEFAIIKGKLGRAERLREKATRECVASRQQLAELVHQLNR